MGLTYITGKIRAENGKEQEVRLLIDSGATYTLIAKDHWEALNLKPKREMEFTLADGTLIKRKISECYISLPQGDGYTPIILGEEGDESLLGAVTLEILGLKLNPFNRSLEPLKMMLATLKA
jgi:clan AA aspartic protease